MGRAEKVTYSQGRKAACEASCNQATARKAAAAKAQASAEEKVVAAWAKHEREAGLYIADPSEANATRVHRARDEAHLLELALTQAKRDMEVAGDAEVTASRALVDAQAEEAAYERAKQVEEGRNASSEEALDRALAPLVAALFEGHRMVRQAAQGMDDLYRASCGAAEELRQLGETTVQDVGEHRLVKPIVEHMIKSNPASAASILTAIENGSWSMFAVLGAERPIGKTVTPCFQNLVLDGQWYGRAEYAGAAQERAIACLRAFFGARTTRQAFEALRAERLKKPAEEQPTPAPRGGLLGTISRIIRADTGEEIEVRR